MKEFIAFDSDKRYTWVEREGVETGKTTTLRVAEKGTLVAVEAIGNWYWIVDEIEQGRIDIMCKAFLKRDTGGQNGVPMEQRQSQIH